MSDFEEKHVYSYELQPRAWYRYIDDIFCIWQYGEDELERFTNHLNGVHSTIKFTIEKSRTAVTFLDTTVSLENNRLETDLFVKPTDRNNYSYHCKKGICSRLRDFKHNCAVKAAQLRQKSYPQTLIREAYAKARDKPRDELLTHGEKSTTTTEQKIYLTTTYNLAYDGLRSQVLKTWDYLDRSSSTRKIHDLGLQVGNHRPKSLRDFLVRSKLPSSGDTLTHVTGAPQKCENHRCRYCPKLNTDGHIIASVTVPNTTQRQLYKQQPDILYILHKM